MDKKKKTCQNSPKEKFQSEMSLVKSCLTYFIQFSLFFFTGQVSKMDTISFGALCDFMEDLRESKENKKKIGKLSRFLAKCRDTLSKDNNDTDLFPIIRLLVPQLDRERGSYGIKETLLSKIVTNLLKLGKTDADRLKNYKTPGKTKDSNDFATILGQVMKDRAYPRTNISIVEINERLSQLILMNANKEGVTEVLMEVFKKMDAVMIKWLVRIILKSMNFEGLGHNGILKCFHQDAKELFDTNADLRKVILTLLTFVLIILHADSLLTRVVYFVIDYYITESQVLMW